MKNTIFQISIDKYCGNILPFRLKHFTEIFTKYLAINFRRVYFFFGNLVINSLVISQDLYINIQVKIIKCILHNTRV